MKFADFVYLENDEMEMYELYDEDFDAFLALLDENCVEYTGDDLYSFGMEMADYC